MLDLPRAVAAVRAADPMPVEGRLRSLRGLSLRAVLRGVRVGDEVEVRREGRRPLRAEVVGFGEGEVLLLPFDRLDGIGPDDPVVPRGHPPTVRVGEGCLGRVLDGLGLPLDGGPLPPGEDRPLHAPPPAPLERPGPARPLATGVRAIDGLVTLAEGQRVGVFAGSGVGKTHLLGRIARHGDADVVVVALIGERGRELRELLDHHLDASARARTVVVCATSDQPALTRLRSASVATALAEGFRDQGARVLLVMDSLTRLVRAGREVGLAAGEPPSRRGFPPSAFARLPPLLERAGPAPTGSITALYSVLVEGGDLDEPVADEVRGLVDGHLVLDRDLAERGRWPAVDVVRSLSRWMPQVTSNTHRAAAQRLRSLVATYEAKRDLVTLGAYDAGRDPRLDDALAHLDAIEAFLRQPGTEPCPYPHTVEQLQRAVGGTPTS
ncbi:MAG: FliI/YscN family ATPase [Sandaracinaceae bacterium]